MLLAMSELHSVSISEIVAYMFALLKLFHETISGVDTSVKNVAHDIAHKVAQCVRAFFCVSCTIVDVFHIQSTSQVLPTHTF